MNPTTVEHPYIRINGNSSYSRHGDIVSLFADSIDNANSMNVSSDNLALQLWACQSPYLGGDLAGWKLAECPLGPLQAKHNLAPVRSDVPASFPESGDYAIALVIAEWDGEGFNRVHDFHNYPNRDVFLHPRMEGSVGYHCVDERRVVVDVGRIYNPRDPENSSGTLNLELWALSEPYNGGAFEGHSLAGITLGSLTGGGSWQDCVYDLKMAPPPAGSYTLALMLREWIGNGYVTRDHTNFAYPVTFPVNMAALETKETIEVDAALAQVASSGQSTSQQSETSVVEDASDTEDLAEPLQQSDTKKASGMTETDTAQEQTVPSEQSAAQVAGSGQPTSQQSVTPVVEVAADTEVQAEPSQLSDTQQESEPNDKQHESEAAEADTAREQVAPSEQSAAQGTTSTVVEVVSGAEPQAVQTPSEDRKPSSIAKHIEKSLPSGYTAALRNLRQRLIQLFEKLKQWLKF